jgi:hypothetical protein
VSSLPIKIWPNFSFSENVQTFLESSYELFDPFTETKKIKKKTKKKRIGEAMNSLGYQV